MHFTSTFKTSVEVGALIRKAVKDSLERIAHRCNVTLTLKDLGGLLESTILITAVGDSQNIIRFRTTVAAYFESLDE